MRLTLVIGTLDPPAGAQRVLCLMANHWAAKGEEVSLLTLSATTPPFYPLHPRVAYRPLNYRWGRRGIIPAWVAFVRNMLRFRADLLATRPDAVISFIDENNVRVLMALAGSRVPVLVSERCDPFEHRMRPTWNFLRRLVYPLASAIVVQTARAGRYFSPRLDERLELIPNPVPAVDQNVEADHLLEPNTVVSMGRLSPQKGYDLLVRAFSALDPAHAGWKLVIFGVGEDREQLEELVRTLGMEGRIRFPGRTKTVHAVMRQAELFVSSSRYEGFPNVLCEAMACGLAVIATDCPSGPREIVTHEADGLLVPNEDVEALTRAMDLLMGDEALRRKLGDRARAISERYGIDAIMALWDRALREKCGVSA